MYYKEYQKKYYEANKEKRNERDRVWKKNNKEKLKAANKKWYENNYVKKISSVYARQVDIDIRTPKWLNKEQIEEINYLYELRKELAWLSEEQLEVDHIVPLRGKNVSGLHVPWNLQVIPKTANRVKGNR